MTLHQLTHSQAIDGIHQASGDTPWLLGQRSEDRGSVWREDELRNDKLCFFSLRLGAPRCHQARDASFMHACLKMLIVDRHFQ